MSPDPATAQTLPELVARAAARYGDRPAITDGAVRLSYRELDAALTECLTSP